MLSGSRIIELATARPKASKSLGQSLPRRNFYRLAGGRISYRPPRRSHQMAAFALQLLCSVTARNFKTLGMVIEALRCLQDRA